MEVKLYGKKIHLGETSERTYCGRENRGQYTTQPDDTSAYQRPLCSVCDQHAQRIADAAQAEYKRNLRGE